MVYSSNEQMHLNLECNNCNEHIDAKKIFITQIYCNSIIIFSFICNSTILTLANWSFEYIPAGWCEVNYTDSSCTAKYHRRRRVLLHGFPHLWTTNIPRFTTDKLIKKIIKATELKSNALHWIMTKKNDKPLTEMSQM